MRLLMALTLVAAGCADEDDAFVAEPATGTLEVLDAHGVATGDFGTAILREGVIKGMDIAANGLAAVEITDLDGRRRAQGQEPRLVPAENQQPVEGGCEKLVDAVAGREGRPGRDDPRGHPGWTVRFANSLRRPSRNWRSGRAESWSWTGPERRGESGTIRSRESRSLGSPESRSTARRSISSAVSLHPIRMRF